MPLSPELIQANLQFLQRMENIRGTETLAHASIVQTLQQDLQAAARQQALQQSPAGAVTEPQVE